MSEVINFPKWKGDNCTAIERLREALLYAESHPEDFKRVIIIWEDAGCIRQCITDSELTVVQALGMIDLAKFDMLKSM